MNNDNIDLLEVARAVGLRELLHGVSAEVARPVLKRFVEAVNFVDVPKERPPAQAEPTAKVRIEAHFDDCVRTSYHDVQIAQAAGGVVLDEDEAFERWWQDHGQFCRAGGGNYEKTFAFQAWQARSPLAQQQPATSPALDARQEALHALARRALWIAFCWNDHNFDAPEKYAREEAAKFGINSFEKANAWLEATRAQPADDQARRDVWIPVSEQLPTEDMGTVAVLFDDGHPGVAWASYWHGARTGFAQWVFPLDELGAGREVTHWTPLPKLAQAASAAEGQSITMKHLSDKAKREALDAIHDSMAVRIADQGASAVEGEQ